MKKRFRVQSANAAYQYGDELVATQIPQSICSEIKIKTSFDRSIFCCFFFFLFRYE